MSEERQYVSNFVFPNGNTYYVKDTEAREDIEELKKHGGGQSDWNQTDSTANDYIKNKPDIYTKNEVDQKLVGAMTYKGIKATTSELPNSGNQQGDVWHITADGSEWAWNGSAWEELGSAVDLSGYRTASAQDTIDAAKYMKPSGGIPKSDLASDVQASLDKADSALQQHQSLTDYATETWVENKGYQTAAQVQSAIANIPDELPVVTASDNGKFLRVVSGAWAAQVTPSAESNSFGGDI